MLAITHATIVTPNGLIPNGTVLIADRRIHAVGGPELSPGPAADVRDATGLILAPGFLDLQVNGGFGLDFTAEPATLWDVAAHGPVPLMRGAMPALEP